MKIEARKFSSHQEAEKADLEFYRSLTGEQRLDLLLDLINNATANEGGVERKIERVYKIVKLKPR